MLSALPVARAHGLTTTLAADLSALAAGRTPPLRLAVLGRAPLADGLRERCRPLLRREAVDTDASPREAHLLWYAVPDARSPGTAHPSPAPPGARLTRLLTGPAAPRATVVVLASDDWGGLGVTSVEEWHRERFAAWPAPWPSLPVRAVLPVSGRRAGTVDGTAALVAQLRSPPGEAPADRRTADHRASLIAELTTLRLVTALRAFLLAESPSPWPHPPPHSAARSAPQSAPQPDGGVAAPPSDPEALWRRCHVATALPAARRLYRTYRTPGHGSGTALPATGEAGPERDDRRGV
ncbi:hypothetical protein ACIRBX_01115 [Kitasatospora sp. NPDC096147]|uniref:hypothetical protein n=1 Tax=Kitasatospora sp. NPDC096147 TaxID=3364093 RepID=UPI00380B7D88